jgi:YHS domain-containing protein
MKTLPFLLSFCAVSGAALAFAPQEKDSGLTQASSKLTTSKEAVIAKQLPSYPLTTCPVSNEGLGEMGEPVNLVYEGRLVRLCCKGCIKQLKKNPKPAFAKVDKAVVKSQMEGYPFETCIVSGEPLDVEGKPFDYVYGTRMVRFCCKGCAKSFKKVPNKFMDKLDMGLIQAQLKDYAMKTCLMRGEELGDDSVNFLYGTRLVRTCCKRCQKSFYKSPEKYVARLDAAKKK